MKTIQASVTEGKLISDNLCDIVANRPTIAILPSFCRLLNFLLYLDRIRAILVHEMTSRQKTRLVAQHH